MAKWIKYKDFNGFDNRIPQKQLERTMKGKGSFNKEYFLDRINQDINKNSELFSYLKEFHSMELI